MFDVTNALYTGFAMIITMFIGYLACKLKYIHYKWIALLNRFNLQVGFFPLMMKGIANKDIKNITFKPIIATALGSITTYLFCLLLLFIPCEDKFEFYISSTLPCCYLNYVAIGPPVFKAIWGETNSFLVSILPLSNDPVSVPIFLILCNIWIEMKNKKSNEKTLGHDCNYNSNSKNIDHQSENDPQSCKERKHPIEKNQQNFCLSITVLILKKLFTNPIILGLIVGLIWSGIGLKLPSFLYDLLEMLSWPVQGIAFLTVGAFLAENSLIACHWAHLILCLIIRHIIFPIFVGIFCWIFNLSPLISRQCIILGSIASAAASYILTETMKCGPEVSSTMLFWSSILTIPVAIAWNSALNWLNLFIDSTP